MLAKQAKRNYRKRVDARTPEHAGIFLEDANDFILEAIHLHDFSNRIQSSEERISDRRSEHNDGPGMFFIEPRNEPALSHGEKWYRIRILRFGAAKDDPLNHISGVSNIVALPKEECPSTEGRH